MLIPDSQLFESPVAKDGHPLRSSGLQRQLQAERACVRQGGGVLQGADSAHQQEYRQRALGPQGQISQRLAGNLLLEEERQRCEDAVEALASLSAVTFAPSLCSDLCPPSLL